jgi:hypothetical protein
MLPATECPGDERTLAGVALQTEQQRERRVCIVAVQRGRLHAVQLAQLLRRPAEALFQVAQVARVGPAGLQRFGHARRCDAMAAQRLEQTVARVRHVAVVATAALGLGTVMRVRLRRARELAVALQTRAIAVHAGAQLMRAPLGCRPRIAVVLVHGVAGRARQLAARVARAVDHAVVLATGDAHHSVAPELAVDEAALVRDEVRDARVDACARRLQ